MQMFTIRDLKASVYMTPFFTTHVADATRTLQRAVADERTNINLCPGDFELYLLGNYDEQQGIVMQLKQPEFICGAAALIQKEIKNG
nr:MAG: nonstructural protein [Microviridae sp.]